MVYLWGVWPTEAGQALARRWNRSVFPSMSQQNRAATARGPGGASPPSCERRRGGASGAQMLAAAQPTAPAQAHESYNRECNDIGLFASDQKSLVPTDQDLNNDSNIYQPRNKSSSYLNQEHYPSFLNSEASNSDMSYDFDESRGLILSVPPLAQSSPRRASPHVESIVVVEEPAQSTDGNGRERSLFELPAPRTTSQPAIVDSARETANQVQTAMVAAQLLQGDCSCL